jgi:hypothetical protein
VPPKNQAELKAFVKNAIKPKNMAYSQHCFSTPEPPSKNFGENIKDRKIISN